MLREQIIMILFDESLCRLSPKTKAKAYVQKEIKKVTKKHYQISRQNVVEFNNAYTVADLAWRQAQKTFIKHGLEYSTIIFNKLLLEKEPWLIKKFKLNPKSFKKLEDNYLLTEHNFRSLKVLNEVLRCVDIEVCQYNYRKGNE